MHKQSGFTLVEISIVIVIIGLILGAAIYGAQTLIANTKATGTAKLITDLSGAVSDFKARFYYLPGDIPNAGTYIPQIATAYPACDIQPSPTGKIGNGLIDNNEWGCASTELVLAGFIKGSPTGIVSQYGTQPDVTVRSVSNSQVYSNNNNAWPPSVKNVIEIAALPCDAANAIDGKIDDGDTTTGNLQTWPSCKGASGASATTTLDFGL